MNLFAMIQSYITYQNTNMRMATGLEESLAVTLRLEKNNFFILIL